MEVDLATFLALDGPLIDVRSPTEYAAGQIPEAYSIPLFTNDERALVGATYKQKGHIEAYPLALEMVARHITPYIDRLQQVFAPNQWVKIYCFRGGMRSSSVYYLARALHQKAVLLEGGYKAFRKGSEELFAKQWNWIVIGGYRSKALIT